MNPEISVVIPCYCCEKSLMELYKRLIKTFNKLNITYEIIFINDSSPMNDWKIIKILCKKNSNVRGLNFSKNFGQHYAITAGIDFCKGNFLVVMDGDLQDQPEEIEKLYKKINEGFDIVYARRVNRQDKFLKKLSSKLFYRTFDYFTDRKSDETIANFSIVNRIVIKTFKRFKEQNRMYPLFLNWMGFNFTYVDVQHSSREMGNSSYSIRKLFKLASDNILSNSNKPLRIGITIGFFITIASLLFGIYLIIGHSFNFFKVEGWTSTMVSIWFIGGMLSFNMGLLGIYIGKIFEEGKQRPIYIIKDDTNEQN
ncbi:glycosyltransferase family 2 protein [Flammeovirga pacifica]|uniref:Glycosyltransferase n=1 Tax=Flammeovirga pacifica TaxID=915059 RepID=A0A1S1YX08_FLAPC|nr:glycosyltransferase family 2 protein [Flammeovirga pacifica]OHX65551.1 glycosyltransferase [Flammeovirga pacifica]